ncbi:hypothetical protein [Methylophaga sp.]|uniref:hypothetical protein n=1 Tax=Methylophaga sp. TaxID=2024840 RepID=UPI003F699509
MTVLVLQIVTKQWDKSERLEKHTKARAQIPNHYPVIEPNAKYLSDNHIILDHHGDDVMGNRLRYEITDDSKFIIDRFGFDLKSRTVIHFPQPDSMLPPRHIATLSKGWIQCHYEWRYKVYEGGFYYWLYENVTVNAAFVESLTEDIFTRSEPAAIIEC